MFLLPPSTELHVEASTLSTVQKRDTKRSLLYVFYVHSNSTIDNWDIDRGEAIEDYEMG
jgi:hypothetical protein